MALREQVHEGTEFLLAAALVAKPLLIAVELQLLIRTAIVEGAATELSEKQHFLCTTCIPRVPKCQNMVSDLWDYSYRWL